MDNPDNEDGIATAKINHIIAHGEATETRREIVPHGTYLGEKNKRFAANASKFIHNLLGSWEIYRHAQLLVAA